MCLDEASITPVSPVSPVVLVADDDHDLIALFARRLRKAGYAVITASDGEEALRLAQDHLPHLAVLDVSMPKLTGIDVIEGLRAKPATRDMLVILISAGFDDDITTRGLPIGADDYIRKPFGPQELPSRVHAVLNR